jgi:thiol-disulfide isomerase/thioredoxin
MLEEMAIIGTTVGEPGILAWLQGQDRLADHKLTLLVFFEVWCPHCKRELPRLEGLRKDWGEQGVGVIGLTSLSRGKTQEEVRAFAASERISYALGHADPQTWELYQVTGVPAIAVIRGGVVVWRGHPASITDEMMRTWLAGR